MKHIMHGGHGTRLYRIWKNVRMRVHNPNLPYSKWYAGKGITICLEWDRDFRFFRDWALANGYADDLSIDRIDNNLGYCPENCRWVTQRHQILNSSRSIPIVIRGVRYECISDAARAYGFIPNRVFNRMRKGRTVEQAMFEVKGRRSPARRLDMLKKEKVKWRIMN